MKNTIVGSMRSPSSCNRKVLRRQRFPFTVVLDVHVTKVGVLGLILGLFTQGFRDNYIYYRKRSMAAIPYESIFGTTGP